MQFISFLSGILTTFIGGVWLTLFFFFVREKLLPLPNIDGSWTFCQKTTKTDYNPYNDMALTFVALLWREGNSIKGTAEKVYEKSSEKDGPFIGSQRSTLHLQGYLQKNIFSPDYMTIHMAESGPSRASSTVQILKVENNNKMSGRFASTIAYSEGSVFWEKKSS